MSHPAHLDEAAKSESPRGLAEKPPWSKAQDCGTPPAARRARICALGVRRGTVVSEESPGSDTRLGAVIIIFNYMTGLCQEGALGDYLLP